MPYLKMQTEGEVLKDKMSVLSSTSDSDIPSLIIVLEELEDLAHKVGTHTFLGMTSICIASVYPQIRH